MPREKVEGDFYKSLSFLLDTYNMTLDESIISDYYPLNISSIVQQVNGLLSIIDEGAECSILRSDEHPATLAVYKTYTPRHCLHFIPMRPLIDAIQFKTERKETLNLILSTFAYLSVGAGIPSFNNEGSFLYYQYEWMKDEYGWQDDPECTEEYRQSKLAHHDGEDLEYHASITHDLKYQLEVGEKLDKQLNDYNAKLLAKRVAKYKPTNKNEALFLSMAEDALALQQAYPDRKIWENMKHDFNDPNEDNWAAKIDMSAYLSFCYTDSQEDEVYSQICITIDADRNDDYDEDLPVQVHLFDKPADTPKFDFTFQKGVFDLALKVGEYIDLLCTENPTLLINSLAEESHETQVC